MNDTEILDLVLNDLEYSTTASSVLRIALANTIKKFRREKELTNAENRIRTLEHKINDLNERFVMHIKCEHYEEKEGE